MQCWSNMARYILVKSMLIRNLFHTIEFQCKIYKMQSSFRCSFISVRICVCKINHFTIAKCFPNDFTDISSI